jgi:excisionase family DNA binding protein
MMTVSDHISVHDAAQLLGRSTEQVRRYLREGKLEGARIGGQWFIDRTALERFQRDLHTPRAFLQEIEPANTADPLGGTIGLGRGGRTDLSLGRDAYREVFRWKARR